MTEDGEKKEIEFTPIDVQGIIEEQRQKRRVEWQPIDVEEIITSLTQYERVSITGVPSKELTQSPSNYISISSEQGNFIQHQSDDIYVDNKARILLFCAPSPEASELNTSGQDALSVKHLDDSNILLIEADGVGSSYRGEIAARASTRFMAENGTSDLAGNLQELEKYLRDMVLEEPKNVSPLILQAWNELRDIGSNTTFNQVLIDRESGNLKGYFHGDGELVIVRNTGVVERHDCGTSTSQIGTKTGLGLESKMLEESLEPGDVMMLFSDGLDKLENTTLKETAEKFKSEDNRAKSVTEVWERLKQQEELRDDDRSLIVYQHK